MNSPPGQTFNRATWYAVTVDELDPPPGHYRLIEALRPLTKTAQPPNKAADLRQCEFSELISRALLANATGCPKIIDALVRPIRASLPLSRITDEFLKDSPEEPLSAIEYALEFVETIAECWRLGLIGTWEPIGPSGMWFHCDSHDCFIFREMRFRGGCVAETSDHSSLADLRAQFHDRLPTWMHSFVRLIQLSDCQVSVSEKPLALGKWQHRALESKCAVELLVLGPYVLCGRTGGASDTAQSGR